LCANSGATLHLVKPLGFGLDDKSLRRSGLDYHDSPKSKFTKTSTNAEDSRRRADLCRGNRRRHRTAISNTAPAMPSCSGRKLADSPAAVLDRVGRESSVSIPMRERSRSINLSNAVALVVYEAWRQIGFLP